MNSFSNPQSTTTHTSWQQIHQRNKSLIHCHRYYYKSLHVPYLNESISFHIILGLPLDLGLFTTRCTSPMYIHPTMSGSDIYKVPVLYFSDIVLSVI